MIKAYDKKLKDAHKIIDNRATERAQVLCQVLRPRFNVTKIIFSESSYALMGGTFPVTTLGEFAPIHTFGVTLMLDVAPVNIASAWKHMIATDRDVRYMRELDTLLRWWLKTTGGRDTEIPN